MGKNKDKVIDIKLDEKEAPKVVSASAKKKAYEILIEAYKVQNPVKYEHKKEALMAKLKNL